MGALVAYILLLLVLIAAAVIDTRTHKVPNLLTLPAILVGFAWAGVWGAIDPEYTVTGKLGEAFFACALAMVVFGFIRYAGALGGGDVKLMMALGAIAASWQVVFNSIVYSMVAMLVLALIVMVRLGIVRRTAKRLVAAAVMASARVKPELDGDTPRIPFALGVAIGGAMAGWEIMLDKPFPWSVYGLG